MSCPFPKSFRLLKRRDFLRRASSRRRYFGNTILAFVQKNEFARTRLGITVTKRFGKAVQRNRFKRVVRDAFRLSRGCIPEGVDIIVRPGKAGSLATMSEVKRELEAFFS